MKSQLAISTSIHWQNVPLREALQRLGDTMQINWFLDRTIDPNQRIELKLENDSLALGLDQLAEANGLAIICYGETLYFGPQISTSALLNFQNRDLGSTNSARKLSHQQSCEWQRLAEPRQIIQELAEDAEIKIKNLEAVPHDVWDRGSIGKQSLAERLDLLLIGFGQSWELVDEDTIRIMPIEFEDRVEPTKTLVEQINSKKVTRRNTRPSNRTKQLYTLQIRDQPLNAVLKQIANQTGRSLRITEEAEEASRKRVSVSVKQVSLEELVSELCNAAGLKSQIEQESILVMP